MLAKNVQCFLLYFLLLSVTFSAYATKIIFQDNSENYQLELVTENLEVPWGMAFLSKHKLLFTQRNGKIGLLNLKTNQVSWIKNIPSVYHNGQAGLLDVAISPDYQTSGWIYFTYSKKLGDQSATTLAKAKLQGNTLQQWQDILISQSKEETNYHYGSRITFDSNGHVFFSIGDRGNRPNAQNLKNHAGSTIRLNLDGSVPDDNPFVGQIPVLPEIWTYGQRNPQGLVYDKQKKRLWSIEHGPRGGDEINLLIAGKNYGWPIISYGKEYWGPVAVGEATHKKGMLQPVKYYVPSIAPGSLMLYSGKAFPQWQGNLFAGALKLKHLNRVVINDNAKAIAEQRLLESLNERIRCVVESPQGWIYLSTDSGKILRMTPIRQ
jgi:aldose sugar dehydrogenase